MAKKNDGYLSAKESRRISRENRRISNEYEKRHKRKNVPESEYLTTMKDPANVVEFDNLHTYFFTDTGVVKSVDGVSFDVPVGKTVGVVAQRDEPLFQRFVGIDRFRRPEIHQIASLLEFRVIRSECCRQSECRRFERIVDAYAESASDIRPVGIAVD